MANRQLTASAADAYDRIRNDGAVWFEFGNPGLIAISGSEAVQFLNGLVTNDVAALSDGGTMEAAFPNAKGRLIAVVRIFREGEKFVFQTEDATYRKVLDNLARFTYAGDFHVEDLTDDFSVAAVRGADTDSALARVMTLNGVVPDSATWSRGGFDGNEVVITPAVRLKGFDVRVPRDRTESLRMALAGSDAVEVSGELAEVLRVESGRPRYGPDMDEETVVPEIGDEGLISYNKGCYIGQEVIARIHFRGKVAKELTGVIFEDPDAVVRAGEELLTSEGRNAGSVRSVVFSPKLGRPIALAYVRHSHLEHGTVLYAGGRECSVRALPFIG